MGVGGFKRTPRISSGSATGFYMSAHAFLNLFNVSIDTAQTQLCLKILSMAKLLVLFSIYTLL